MKTFTDEALAALERGDAIVAGALAILSDPPVRLFSGYGTITIDGEDFEGVGDRAIGQVTAGAIGGQAQGLTLTLSGIEPNVIELLEADEISGAGAILYRLIFDSAGKTLIDGHVFIRGRVDTVEVEETIGGAAAIRVAIESAARGLGRRGGRMRSDPDQRLIDPSDGFFKNVAFAAQKTLYWGGKRPAVAGAAIPPGGGSPAYRDVDRSKVNMQ